MQRAAAGRWHTVATVTVARPTDIAVPRLPAGSYRLVVPATTELLGVITGVIRVR